MYLFLINVFYGDAHRKIKFILVINSMIFVLIILADQVYRDIIQLNVVIYLIQRSDQI